MFIKLTPATTPAQAIQMAYQFAGALRATGWPPEDITYARALWIGAEYTGNSLLAYLDAGFGAGYVGDPMPSARDITVSTANAEAGMGETVTPDGRVQPAKSPQNFAR
jgi:hypothetical protein